MRLLAFAAALLVTLPALAGEGRWERTVAGGCLVWNARPHDGETASWSGGCEGGKISGQGTLIWRYQLGGQAVEETHTGSMRRGRAEGHVVSRFPNGFRYDGEYVNALNHGHGSAVYPNGDRYEGAWRYGERNGQGTYTWADGDSYAGEWLGGKPNGPGRLSLAGGGVYAGDWSHGCFQQDERRAWAFASKADCGFR
jgi:hypothetical protein